MFDTPNLTDLTECTTTGESPANLKSETEAKKVLSLEEDILSALDRDLKRSGFAGSTLVPRLVFLCLYTGFFDRPVSLVIKGPSGSGKSFALNSAIKFVPPDAYELFSGMSEKALVYSGLNLEHRHLIIQEAAGMSKGDGRMFLRQLLSEGELRYQTVQNTRDGLTGKELPPIKGPAGLLMTTTANGLHLEDESRLLSFHMDESPERIREALRASLNKSRGSEVVDYGPWHDLHAFVGSHFGEVAIPFEETLIDRIPVTHFRVMRDFPQVKSLIAAHALMHQKTREIDMSGRVIASLTDYATVRELVEGCLAHGLEVAVPQRIREVVEAVEALLSQTGGVGPSSFGFEQGVSQRKIADHLNRDQSVVSRNVKEAVFQGYLEDRNPGQGRISSLVLGERQLPSGYVLPTVEELKAS